MTRAHIFGFVGGLLLGAAGIAAADPDPDSAEQRARFPAVWEAAKRDPTQAWMAAARGLETYPLYPYLGLAALQRRIAQARPEEIGEFLKAWPGTLPALLLREAYLNALAKRGDWANYLAFYDGSARGTERRCWALQARLAQGEPLDFARDFQPVWLSANLLPGACDAATRWAQAQRKLTPALVWQRIELASAKANAGLVAALAPLLDGSERTAAERIALVLRDPAAALDQGMNWPDEPRAREALALAFARLARSDAVAAQARWPAFAGKFHFDREQQGRALRAIALYHATNYPPDALAWLDALPADLADDATREWRVRAALAAKDFPAALRAIQSMPAAQREDLRWRYLRARLTGKLGNEGEARAMYETLAVRASYYGFLAADRLGMGYAICNADFVEDAGMQTALRRNPDLARAFEFFALDRLPEARREWDYAQDELDPAQRRQALALAAREGWIDRAVLALNQDEDRRYYDLRFPLAYRAELLRGAQAGGVEPAWAYAIIRAESAWVPDAKSAANAYGLMQLLPGTAAPIARSAHLDYGGANALFDPALNIALGARYLGQVAARFDGSPWLGSAAYNAGPGVIDRWIGARDDLDPDFFIETMPYKETREYVSSVLAFSVIYDWRLNGATVPLSTRLPRIGQAYDPPGDRAARKKTVACAAPPAAEKSADTEKPADR